MPERSPVRIAAAKAPFWPGIRAWMCADSAIRSRKASWPQAAGVAALGFEHRRAGIADRAEPLEPGDPAEVEAAGLGRAARRRQPRLADQPGAGEQDLASGSIRRARPAPGRVSAPARARGSPRRRAAPACRSEAERVSPIDAGPRPRRSSRRAAPAPRPRSGRSAPPEAEAGRISERERHPQHRPAAPRPRSRPDERRTSAASAQRAGSTGSAK